MTLSTARVALALLFVPALVAAQGTAGSGADGAVQITGTVNCQTTAIASGRSAGDCVATALAASVVAGATVVPVADATGFAANDELLLIQMVSNPGVYEFAHVASTGSGTITITQPLSHAYFRSGTTVVAQVVRVPNYTTVSVNGGGTLTVSAWNGLTGGVLAIRAQTSVTIAATGAIDLSGTGYAGASPVAGGAGGGGAYIGGGSGVGGGGSAAGTAGLLRCHANVADVNGADTVSMDVRYSRPSFRSNWSVAAASANSVSSPL